jgi:hypothetical protein
MKHRGLNKTDKYYKDGYKYVKAKQVEMIQRHYVDYSEKDWVLWIVCDLFHNYSVEDIIGLIEIKKKNGDLIEIPYILRTPYPNKRISQLSMKSGRKRLYGIPLVFKSFEKLCEIEEIKIKWDIYEKWYSEGVKEPTDLYLHTLVVKYILSFKENDKNPGFRFFTVNSKDNTYKDDEEKDKESVSNYYNEFDAAITLTGNFMRYDINNQHINVRDIFTLKEKEKRFATDKEETIIDTLIESPDKDKINELIKNVLVKEEVQWEASYYERTETLKAEFMADILTESSFGFAKGTIL